MRAAPRQGKKGEGMKSYRKYLNSEEWRTRRKALLRERGRACERCAATKRLHVHHLTYVRLGSELPSDLQILCADCHAEIHRKRPRPIKPRKQHQKGRGPWTAEERERRHGPEWRAKRAAWRLAQGPSKRERAAQRARDDARRALDEFAASQENRWRWLANKV